MAAARAHSERNCNGLPERLKYTGVVDWVRVHPGHRGRMCETLQMAFEDGTRPRRTGPKPRQSTVTIVPARPGLVVRPEFRRDGTRLEVSFAAPEIPEGRFRYRLGKRYLFAWADDAPQGQHYFVVLPVAVEARGHEIRLVNGVVDARLSVRQP